MDLNDIKFFMLIAQGSTYDAIAEQEYTTQSSLSKAIIRLEKELDIKLFDRSHRSVSLTPAGECFYNDIKKVYHGLEEALQHLRSYSEQKLLYCCVVPAWSIANLREYIQRFARNNPEIRLMTSRRPDKASALSALLNGTLDFVIMHQPVPNNHNLDIALLMQDDIFVILPKSHPLAGKQHITLSDLKDETLMARPLLQKTLSIFGENLCYMPKLIEYDERREIILASIAFGNQGAIFYESDLTPFNLKEVSVGRLTGLPPTPLVLISAKERKLHDYQKVFKEYLIDVLSQA